MIQNMHNKRRSFGALIIVGIIAVPFALFGITSVFQTSVRVTDVAEVNGDSISTIELARAVNNRQQQLIERFGENIDPQYYDEATLRPVVLDELILRQLFVSMLKNNNMGVSDTRIKSEILSIESFRVNGRFSPAVYRDTLNAQGFTGQSFLSKMEDDGLNRLFVNAIRQSEFIVDEDLNDYIAIIAQSRNYTYLKLDLDNELKKTKASTKAVSNYYEENKTNWQVDEKITVKYIQFSKQDMANVISIPEDAVKQKYDLLQQENTSVQSEVAHILLEEKEDGSHLQVLSTIQKRLEENADFAELAKEFSDDIGSASAGGYLGFTDGSAFPESFETALSLLETNQVSDVVTTDDGLHLIKLISKRQGGLGSFEEEKIAVQQQLMQDVVNQKFTEAIDKINELSYSLDTLQDVVNAFDSQIVKLEIKTSSPFARNGAITGIGSYPNVVKAAFNDDVYKENLLSKVIEVSNVNDGESVSNTDSIAITENQLAVLVSLDNIQPSYIPQLADINTRVTQELKRNKAIASLKEKAKQHDEQISAGGNIEKLAQKKNLDWQVQIEAQRDSEEEIDQLAFEIFADQLPKTNIATLNNGDVVVIRLDKVQPGKKSDFDEKQLFGLYESLANNQSLQSLDAYQKYLYANADIEKN